MILDQWKSLRRLKRLNKNNENDKAPKKIRLNLS